MAPKKDTQFVDSEDTEISIEISFKDLEKSMTIFTGDDTYPIETFITEFEDVAQIMKWNKVEMLIYVKRLLNGTAKLFLRSFGSVKDYSVLKKALIEEFGPKINSAVIHKKLSARKMKSDETIQQYFLTMKELAFHGNVEDAALMEYIIDGIQDIECNKVILYGAADLKEFRKKLDIYGDFRKRTTPKTSSSGTTYPSPSGRKPLNIKRCFNCGDQDHQAPACTKGVKCFKCNSYGHKSAECQNETITKTLNIQKRSEEKKGPYKKIMINDEEITTLIDTGSDVNIIKKTEFMKIKDNVTDYDIQSVTILTGIADKQIYTEGTFTANIQVDGYCADIKFHVVKDNEIPVNVIIGNPILNYFEVNFTHSGVYMEKIPHLTLLVEENNEEYEDEEVSDKEELVEESNQEDTNTESDEEVEQEDGEANDSQEIDNEEIDEDNNIEDVENAEHEIENNSVQISNVNEVDSDDNAVASDDEAEPDDEVEEMEEDEENELTEENHNTNAQSNEKIENTLNTTHDTTGRNRKKEATAKLMYKSMNIQPSMAPPRESTGMSDSTKNSSAEGSGWDSHRTTRKSLRQTFGNDFTMGTSLRALVMEKSAKQRHTEKMDLQWETVKYPQANSTELPDEFNRIVMEVEESLEESDHEVSRRMRHTTLETYLQKIKQDNLVKKIGSSGPINTTNSADFMKLWISPEDDSSGTDEQQDDRVE